MCIKPFKLKLENGDIVDMPCGQCVACKIAYSREWAMRLLHELTMYDKATFLTLTYSDEYLVYHIESRLPNLEKSHLTRFWKRLRKAIKPRKMKYFACGEYGDEHGRPHYHAIVFNLGIDEKPLVEKVWGKGRVDLGTVTYDSCRYVADYVLKKYNGEKMKEVYNGRINPFKTGSQGLGERFALANRASLEEEEVIRLRGQKVGLPRYYRKKLGLEGEYNKTHAIDIQKKIHEYHERRGASNLVEVFKEINKSRSQAEKELLARQAMAKKRNLSR